VRIEPGEEGLSLGLMWRDLFTWLIWSECDGPQRQELHHPLLRVTGLLHHCEVVVISMGQDVLARSGGRCGKWERRVG
jgi:hypothetical protein